MLEATIPDKAEAAAAVAKETEARADREANFLTRKRKASGAGGRETALWRPQKRHRKASFQWVVWIDHQLRSSTIYKGLTDFAVPADRAERGHWSGWNHLTLVSDQGSPELCGISFLQQKLKLCVDDISDFGHGCHRDLGLALRRAHLWDHVLLRIALWNVPHGPWSEDVRSKEVQAVWRSMFTRYSRPEDSPLFMEVLPFLMWENNDKASSAEEGVALRYWEWCQDMDPFKKKGAKTNLNRFLSYLIKGEEEAPLHSLRLLGYLSCCLQCDYLGSSKMTRLLCSRGTKQEGNAREVTSSNRPDSVDSAMAKAAINQLAVGTLVLLDRPGQLVERGIQRLAAPLRAWYGNMSREVRNVWRSSAWMIQELRTNFIATLSSILKVLSTPADLAWIGVKLPRVENLPTDLGSAQAVAIEQDELVQHVAIVGLLLVGCRLIRCAFMTHGYSCRSILWRDGDPDFVRQELQRFKRGYELDQKLKLCHLGEPGAQDLLMASQFRLMVVEQLVEAMLPSDFSEVTPEVDQFLSQKHNRLMTSEIVENAFNRQKKMKTRDHNRRLDLRRAWGVLLDREVLDKVNSFETAKFEGLQPTRSANLPAMIQEPPLSGCSVDCRQMSSHKQKVDWYSPGAQKHSVKYLAQVTMEYADKHQLWGSLDQGWLNCFFRAGHSVLVREVGDKRSVFFALQDIGGTCAAVWPAMEVKMPAAKRSRGATLAWVPKPEPSIDELFIVALAAERWEALWIQWRSPAWQAANLQLVEGRDPAVVRAFARPGASWAPLLVVGARAGFWDLPMTTLKAVAEYKGIEVEARATLFSTLFAVVQGVLQCPENEVLPICQQRVATMASQTEASMSEVILEMDEGQAFLDQDEKKELQAAKKSKNDTETDAKAFKAEYKARRGAISSRSAAGSRNASGHKNASAPKASRYPPVPLGMLTQPQARSLLPPKAHVWRGLSNGSWNVFLAPHPRKSFSWALHGENESCLMCLRHVWRLHLEGEGQDISQCPVPGLLSGDDQDAIACGKSSGSVA